MVEPSLTILKFLDHVHMMTTQRPFTLNLDHYFIGLYVSVQENATSI